LPKLQKQKGFFKKPLKIKRMLLLNKSCIVCGVIGHARNGKRKLEKKEFKKHPS
jgi:hypothetical protein